jgi:hypothetical protein
MVKLMREKLIAGLWDGPHRVGSLGMVRSFRALVVRWEQQLCTLLLRDMQACVWDCLAGCTSIAIAALLQYGYHFSYHYHRS